MSRWLSAYKTRDASQIIFCLLILTIIGIKWSLGLSRNMDLLFGDEAEYIRNGLDLFHIVRNDWGPAYNMWYKILSYIYDDPIQLYYANYIIGGILVSLLLFIALICYRTNLLVAFYVSYCFFTSSLNIDTWPRISHFVLIIMLSSIIVISKIKSHTNKTLIFSICCYLCAYARPELFLAFILSICIFIYYLIKKKETSFSSAIYFILLIIIIVFFQTEFGFPSSTYKDGLNRLYSAFCQHYTINYRLRYHTNFDAVTEWIEFCKTKFPNCHSIIDVVVNHPQEFLQNLIFNIRNYILLFLITACSLIFPTGLIHGKKMILTSGILLITLLFLVFINQERRIYFYTNIRKQRLLFLLLLIFGLPSFVMCTIIFPRNHYLLLHIIFIVFLLAYLLQSLLHNTKIQNRYLLLLGIILILISPVSKDYKYVQFGKDMDNLCEQKLIKYLTAKQEHSYVVFTNYLNVTYLLPKNYTEFSTEFKLKRGMRFEDILNKQKINIILVSINILQNPILVKDPVWNDLIKSPEKYQFKKVRYSEECDSYLLIKEP